MGLWSVLRRKPSPEEREVEERKELIQCKILVGGNDEEENQNLRVGHECGEEEKEMMRTRLLWFTAGFSVTGATIAQFVWKDLWGDRVALSAQTKQRFDALQARVLDLETKNLGQVEG